MEMILFHSIKADLKERRVAADPGVVDEDVDAAERIEDGCDHGRHGRWIGDVDRDRNSAPCCLRLATASSAPSRLMSAITTAAPSRTNVLAIASPMPRLR